MGCLLYVGDMIETPTHLFRKSEYFRAAWFASRWGLKSSEIVGNRVNDMLLLAIKAKDETSKEEQV